MVNATTGLAGSSLTPCLLKNSSGEEIPPFSLCRVTATASNATDDDGPLKELVTLTVGKPNSSFVRPLVCSGPIAIPDGKTGPGFMGAVLPVDVTASIGDRVGPSSGSWAASASPTGDLLIIDSGSGGVAVALVSRAIRRVRGTATAEALPGSAITIGTLVGLDGDATDLGATLSVANTHDWAVHNGATVRAEYNETDEVWEAYQVDCYEES